MKNNIIIFLVFSLITYSSLSFASEENKLTNIGTVSDAIKYVGYKKEISLSVPKNAGNENEYTLPKKVKNVDLDNVYLKGFYDDIFIKHLSENDNNYLLTINTIDSCSSYGYKRNDLLKTIRIDFCNGYVNSVELYYDSANKYRLSSEEIDYNLKKITEKLKEIGFKEEKKINSKFLDIVNDDQPIRLEKNDIVISVEKGKRDDNVIVSIQEKDSKEKYLKAKEALAQKSKEINDLNIESFFK